MPILTYKYRVKDISARKTLVRHAAACNVVWNYCNAFQRDIEARYRAGAPMRKWPTGFDLSKLCKGAGVELGIYQQTVQVVCDQYASSRNKNRHSTCFRSSYGAKRARGWVPFQKQSRQVEGNSIWYLGKRFRFFGSKRRPLPENAGGGCFVEDALGRWYVCFYVDVDDRQHGNGVVGIDLGLKYLAAMSDGRKIEPPRFFKKFEGKLGSAQRAGNTQRVRRIHAKIKNSRNDFLHKLSTILADQNAIIAVGNVKPKQLAKARMAKSVMDAGWSMFRSMLKYKSAGYVEVDEKFTTQTCSHCGALPPERPKGIAGLGIREWECSSCGASHDRDVNAAKNILALALSAERPVVESRVET